MMGTPCRTGGTPGRRCVFGLLPTPPCPQDLSHSARTSRPARIGRHRLMTSCDNRPPRSAASQPRIESTLNARGPPEARAPFARATRERPPQPAAAAASNRGMLAAAACTCVLRRARMACFSTSALSALPESRPKPSSRHWRIHWRKVASHWPAAPAVAGQWLARKAPEVVSPHGFKLCAALQSR